MTKTLLKLLYFALIFLTFQSVKAQDESIINACNQKLPFPYISDGQQYRALINKGEIAEFRATFYGKSTYRIVACSGLEEGNLIFTLYDQNRNELFTNRNFKNSSYWDFQFTSTVDCIIEAQLDTKAPLSGFALLLIGFKQ